jgi:hypothetical protein
MIEGRSTQHQSKKGLNRRPTTHKVVRNWKSGVHFELEF